MSKSLDYAMMLFVTVVLVLICLLGYWGLAA
jgi:hypothetical protein